MFVPSIHATPSTSPAHVAAGIDTLSHSSHVAAAGADQTLSFPAPQLSIGVPFASVVYSGAGVHITYTMLVRDDAQDIEWHSSNRYSAFRQLHVSVGKGVVGSSASFPPMMLTSRANRDKAEIEMRRRRLEVYMQTLLQSLFPSHHADTDPSAATSKRHGSSATLPLQKAIKVLRFIEYPFIDVWLNHRTQHHFDPFLSDALATSSPSEATGGGVSSSGSVGGSRISALEPDTERTTVSPPPNVVTTRWKPPPVTPGKNLGIQLPYVSLVQDVDSSWSVVLRADRTTKKGFLRHRYDEAVSLCSHMATLEHVLDATEAQEFITRFRREHPLSAYLTVEHMMTCTSPTSASRVDRSSSGPPQLTDESQCSPQTAEEDIVGSPVVHHHRASFGDETAVRRLFTSLRSLDDHAAHHAPILRGAHYMLDVGKMEGCRGRSRSTENHSSNLAIRGYLDAICGVRLEGCQCSRKTFCSTNEGDVYTTDNGFAIVVCPPAASNGSVGSGGAGGVSGDAAGSDHRRK